MTRAASAGTHAAAHRALGSTANHAAEAAPAHMVIVPSEPGPRFAWDRAERLEAEREWNRQEETSQSGDILQIPLP